MSLRALRSFLLSGLCLLLANCAASKPDNDTLRLSIPTEVPTLDPNLATDSISFLLLNQLQEGLTQFDDHLNVLPANAKRWTVSADGRTYRFFLDPAYHWSDGIPVKAQDFVNSWLRLLSPQTASPYAYFLYAIQGAQAFNQAKNSQPNSVGVHAVNDAILEVTLEKPTAYFPMITTFMVTYPIRKDLLEKYPHFYTQPRRYVSNGSYTLTAWRHDYQLTLKRNPHYGGNPQPKIGQVKIYVVPEPMTALALYLRDDLDYVPLPALAVQKYERHPDHLKMEKLRGYYFGFNQKIAPFDRVAWRQAFALALDKSQIPKILRGGEEPADSWIPKGMLAHAPNIGLHFDPQKARDLIAAELPQWQDKPFALHFNSDPVNKRIAEWAQSEWRKHLGVTVELVNEEWKSYLTRLEQNPPQIFRHGWGADFPDPDNFMNLFTASSGNNHTQWRSPEYDALIDRAARLNDLQIRKRLYDQAQKLLLERETVIVPLFIPAAHYLASPRVRPLPLNPLDFVYFKKMEIKKDTPLKLIRPSFHTR